MSRLLRILWQSGLKIKIRTPPHLMSTQPNLLTYSVLQSGKFWLLKVRGTVRRDESGWKWPQTHLRERGENNFKKSACAPSCESPSKIPRSSFTVVCNYVSNSQQRKESLLHRWDDKIAVNCFWFLWRNWHLWAIFNSMESSFWLQDPELFIGPMPKTACLKKGFRLFCVGCWNLVS
jgi:hypothetical protein